MKYVVISPVKDEERNIEKTLHSMAHQTLKPVIWIVVDDGSSDRTVEIVEAYARNYTFIQLIRNQRLSVRETGIAEVLAFDTGLKQIKDTAYDCVVKLDGDLSFEPDYFRVLLTRFDRAPRLGIASGVYLEQENGVWREISMPSYHAAGASKVVRRECFEEIGGFIARRGWDTVDEIRARSRGWDTTHFDDLKMKHWKPEGVGMGRLRTCYMHGEIFYRTGGGWLFLLLKCVNRIRNRPVVTGGLMTFWGYLHSRWKRLEPLVTLEEAQCYRALLIERFTRRIMKSRKTS